MKKLIENFIDITRIKRPTGIILLLIPCLIGVFSNIIQPLSQIFAKEVFDLIILFVLGSIVMRSAGCIINDIFDRKFDSNVSRTKNRPLASGKMTLNQAIISLMILLIIGLVILLQFNNNAIICGVFSLFLVIFYPLMKRITHYPQIFLGIVYNIGFLISTLQIKSKIEPVDLLIYFSLIIITFTYDTIYGFQDIEDDLKIGVKSSSIIVKKSPKAILTTLICLSFLLIFSFGIFNGYSLVFFVVNLFALTYSILLIYKWNIKDQQGCLKTFKKFTNIGFIIMTSFIFKL